ncbi:MAG TPA: hypothetical protein VKT75_17995 [Acidobacteriaceae bacterium]|nr:hypothetical protein [Acidobacteriaceae bacterium]
MSTLTACLRAIVNFFAEILLGCSHSRVTRPFTIKGETYMVCLSCGKQIYYSAKEMRPFSMGEVRRMKAATADLKMMPIPASVPALMPAQDRKPNVAA